MSVGISFHILEPILIALCIVYQTATSSTHSVGPFQNWRVMLQSLTSATAFRIVFLALSLSLGVSVTLSQMHHQTDDSLGTISFPVSCTPATQSEFNRAMTLFHHMTYPAARVAFQKVVADDPKCAMGYWGIAMTLFQPLWPTRPGDEDLHQGWDAVQKAESLHPRTERERLLIMAAEAFFREPDSSDYWRRIHRWAAGMEQAYTAFPEDHEVAALYALALLSTVPPDQLSSPNNAKAADILLRILRENPHHPGAMHYLIHANDAPGRERESLAILREYEKIAPHNPHALHMPTHIYTRLGNWPEVIRGNIRAAEAALDFPAGDQGQFIWDEFPHAIEYLIYAYLQSGQDDSADAQLKRLQGTANLEPTFKTAFHLASTRARYALERKDWENAAAIEPREPASVTWNRFPWAEAISWFARGIGCIHTGILSESERSQARLAELEAVADKAREILFLRNIRILRLEITALLAEKRGLRDSSLAMMKQAAELEASTPKHPVTPAPTLPAYELLGDLLLEQGNASEARKAYDRSLDFYPLRFNSLWGSARAAMAMNDAKGAAALCRQLLTIAGRSNRKEIQEARTFLSK